MGALDGKTALITGGASGIGRASAYLFAAEGASVSIVDIDPERGSSVVSEIERKGGRALFIRADVTCYEDGKRSVAETVSRYGGLHVLFNNAGIIARRSVVEMDEPEWDRIMNVNVKSAFLMSKLAIPRMQAAGGGAIINMASGWGLTGGPKAAAYCASKGAVVLLTKAMAIDCGPYSIRVNCLCPGDTDTPMLREEARQLSAVEAEFLRSAARRPLGRVGTPDEIARAALFLATEQSSFVTGIALIVDGGGLAGS